MNSRLMPFLFSLLALTRTVLGAELTMDKIFPTDHVLDVQINVENEDWDTIRHQSRNLYEALGESRQFAPIKGPYTYVNANVTIDGVEFPNVGLRKKGFIGSQNPNRPSLKIKLNHTDKKADIGGLTTLTFNNNQQDISQISQVMGYALFNQIGSPAPRCVHAQITVNGKNLGIYAHVESVRKPLMKRGFDNDKGTLMEGTVVDFHQDWEKSFEHKFGKDKRARKKIKDLIQAVQGKPGETILNSTAMGRAWVPTEDDSGTEWTGLNFDDSHWAVGQNGAGYENETGFESLISDAFDFNEQLYNKSESLYLRFPFQIDDLDKVLSKGDFFLRAKYDDGFVVYLNGHQVATSNAPENPQWDSKAVGSRPDAAAMAFESINLSAHKDKLRQGKNILAVHGLNIDRASTDMLMLVELETNDYDYEKEIGRFVDLDAFYTFWAVEGLLGFWDGYSGNRNNFFIYLNPETDKFHFLPWGADALFEKFSKIRFDPLQPVSVKTQGLIANKLYQLESGRKRYAETIKAILTHHWDEAALLAETERIETLVRPHLASSQRNLSAAMEERREFIRTRRAEILAEIESGMPNYTAAAAGPAIIRAQDNPRNARRRRSNNNSIWIAARAGKVDEVKKHLEKGTNVNIKDEQGGTLVSAAALAGQLDVVRFLIEEGVNLKLPNNDRNTALHAAAFLGHLEVVELLIEAGSEINAKNNNGETPLDSSAGEWNQELKDIVNFFVGTLQMELDPDDVKENRPKVASFLRSEGGKLGSEIRTPKGKDLWSLAKLGKLVDLKQALSDGSDPNALDDKGITPIAWAAMADQSEAVQLLIDAGANINAKNRDGNGALHGAAFLGRLSVVELMTKNKATVNIRNNEGETPLGSSAAEWNAETQGIVEFIAGILEIEVNLDEVKSGREKSAALLRQLGGKTGEQLR